MVNDKTCMNAAMVSGKLCSDAQVISTRKLPHIDGSFPRIFLMVARLPNWSGLFDTTIRYVACAARVLDTTVRHIARTARVVDVTGRHIAYTAMD